jgi:MFS family permease
VNVPFSVVALIGAFALLRPERIRLRLQNLDARGAFLVTGGMLLLVYTLVKAPDVGWSTPRTIGGLAFSAAILTAFVVNELRVANPLVPLSILRIKGVAAADATQMVMVAGLLPMFFFLTLYMQTVLNFSPIQTGVAYLPFTAGVIVVAGVSSQLFARFGTKVFIVAGALVGAGGLYWLSRIPVDGSYVSDILPGMLIVAFGLGAVFVGATTAANAGINEDKAGLAAGLLNTGQQLGGALGLAILSAIATAQTTSLLQGGHDTVAEAVTGGYQRALLVGAGLVLAAAAVALFASDTRETKPAVTEEEPALDLAA